MQQRVDLGLKCGQSHATVRGLPLCVYAVFVDIKINLTTVRKKMECKNKVNKKLNNSLKAAKTQVSFRVKHTLLMVDYSYNFKVLSYFKEYLM